MPFLDGWETLTALREMLTMLRRLIGEEIDLVWAPGEDQWPVKVDPVLLVTDVVMPEMSGRDLAELIGAIRPEIRSLFMSGYTADVITRRGVVEEGIEFIQKAFSIDGLAAKVREVLDQPD